MPVIPVEKLGPIANFDGAKEVICHLALLLQFAEQPGRLLPRDRRRRLVNERPQRRDHRAPADPLQRQRGQPTELFVFVAQGRDQLADGYYGL